MLNGKRSLKRSGDITAKENSTIEVGGENNFGFVVNNSAHNSYFEDADKAKTFTKEEYEWYKSYMSASVEDKAKNYTDSKYDEIKKIDHLIHKTDKANHGKGINKGKITVTGSSSVGFAMVKGGNSENSGTLQKNLLLSMENKINLQIKEK